MRDLGPWCFIFTFLWLPLRCSAYRPAVDQEELGSRSLQLEAQEATEPESEVSPGCPEEVLKTYRSQLQGLGLKVHGNPCQWRNAKEEVRCEDCKVIYIVSLQADGDLVYLENMTDLRVLNLEKSQVTGNLENLRKLTQLEFVWLSQTHLLGDVEVFKNITQLSDLHLAETKVAGDISAFHRLRQLSELHLSDSNVSGDVEVFQHLTDLDEIGLAGTKVSGDLASFSQLVKLGRLHLRETQVAGNVSSLEKLTRLRELNLGRAEVFGQIRVIRGMKSLERLDISGTKISGSFDDLYTCCWKLRDLNAADSFFTSSSSPWSARGSLFPALQFLDVSGSFSNSTVHGLLQPLLNSPIASLYASRCGLSAYLGNFMSIAIHSLEDRFFQTLHLLDLSENTLDEVAELPVKSRLDLSRNRRPLRISPAVIEQAAKDGIDLWLTDTRLENPQEMKHLLASHLRPTEVWVPRENAGFSCHELVAPNFRVTPELFMPDDLCACRPGFSGRGTNCTECPSNTFSNVMNQPKCQQCPADSTSPPGSSSVNACMCRFGSVEKIGSEYACACAKNKAQTSEQRCVSCSELHLLCPEAGELVATAHLQPGFIRLKNFSEEIFQCLDEKKCRNSSCTPGHVGPLCADCAPSFRATRRGCIECKNVFSQQKKIYMVLGGVATLLISAAVSWNFRHRLPSLSPRQHCLLKLLMRQSAVLLQVVQLWTILGRLPRAAPGDPFVSYLEMLQFTGSDLQNLLALQCLYDGVTVRMLFALATPLVPLLLLLICAFLEIFSRGLGIRIGLKTLTVLFIGGAGGSAQLLECQRTDAAGLPLKKFAFRPLFPHQLCDETPWVDAVGWGTAACYGLLIPAFLGFLFMKQNVVMRSTKTVVTQTTLGKGRLMVRLQGLESENTCEEQLLGKRLAAAAAACVAHHVTGRAIVELQKDAVIVVPLAQNAAAVSDEFRVKSLVFGGDGEKTRVLQRHATAQMLMERSILEEEDDRFMRGASHMLSKYAKCRNLWMEVCSKVAAAALVSVVAINSLWLCVAITLGMALVTSLARPFAQPQLNDLQATGFACLAVAAVGFRHYVLLANLALAVPLVLLVLQLRRPDSVEMLALRLQQELESKIHEGPVEVSAEQFA